jgi:7-keto-8-aminopelargonate synthetase-like enzyme
MLVAVEGGGRSAPFADEADDFGLLANLVEYPAVGKGAARFRMQVMARHTQQNIADRVERMAAAVEAAKRE